MRVITDLRVKRTNGSYTSGCVSKILRYELPVYWPSLKKAYPDLTGREVSVWFNLEKTGNREWCCTFFERVDGHWEVGAN